MTLNRGKIALIVHGEAEECPFEEKVWIVHVILNRLKQPHKFRDLSQDFHGYTRKMKITNAIERQAFEDSINAVFEALEERKYGFDPTQGAVFFATKKYMKDKDPAKVFGVLVEEVYTPRDFLHAFYRLRVIK